MDLANVHCYRCVKETEIHWPLLLQDIFGHCLMITLSTLMGLGLLLPEAEEPSLTTFFTIVGWLLITLGGSWGIFFLSRFARRNIIGTHLFFCRDEEGNIHWHADEPALAHEDYYTLRKSFDSSAARPVRRSKDSPIIEIRIGGWFQQSDAYHHKTREWDIQLRQSSNGRRVWLQISDLRNASLALVIASNSGDGMRFRDDAIEHLLQTLASFSSIYNLIGTALKKKEPPDEGTIPLTQLG
jgi:hypothetical protein